MRIARRFWWILPVVLIIVTVGFVAWAESTNPIEAEAESALQADAAVNVETSPWLTFTPTANSPTTGLIIYPGGKVDAAAYAPLARAVAESGYLAVIVPMPLNLAVFDVGAARDIIAAYPTIEHWGIAGHSLGGSMAARFVFEHPGAVAGLLLLASYAVDDLSAFDLEVTVMYGTRDGVAAVEQVRGGADLLPATAEWIEIVGGNHAQFGWYGEQAGDNAATISHAAQYEQVIAAARALLTRISAR